MVALAYIARERILKVVERAIRGRSEGMLRVLEEPLKEEEIGRAI